MRDQSRQELHIEDGHAGPIVCQAKAARFRMSVCPDGTGKSFTLPSAPMWLILAQHPLEATLHLCWQDVSLDDRAVRIECREDWQDKSRRNDVCLVDERGVDLLRRLWAATTKRIEGGREVPDSRGCSLPNREPAGGTTSTEHGARC